MEKFNKQTYSFEDLLAIADKLRSPGGCPWDIEQTHDSVKQCIIEEAYEAVDAINKRNDAMLYDELGDVLFQVIFHSQIAKEEGSFDIGDVITAVCKKMIGRHAHVFGDKTADTSGQVLDLWDEIKKEEKGLVSYSDGLKDVTINLPALIRAYKVQQKAKKAGFDWDNIQDVYNKIEEELEEVKEAVARKDDHMVQSEIGDLLFAAVNLSRFLKVQPELALTDTTERFIKRFEYMEKMADAEGQELDDMSLSEMDEYWEKAKEQERGK